ncbi:MAG TPA: UDP-3-O-(3-hydroxymyristoyl)glucosamine N-acyltransferase [Fimbriimonadales bacterium]|nr:UDP-3-O-(3-hydroxymyristoyl)glucosamine N-acyltransferase [Fimbriimonadales bacterium]
MAEPKQGWTLEELAEILGGELSGPSNVIIRRPVPAGHNDAEGITFAENAKYLELVEKSDVAAVILPEKGLESKKPSIRCRAPREAFGRILALVAKELPLAEGVHPTCVISPEAQIDEGAAIGAYCVVESGTKIAPGAKIYPFCYIGENCQIEAGAKLYPHVVLYKNVRIGERTIVHSGAVLGADGFGFFWDGEKRRKIPQVGSVVIGDDCEIGALTAIDRATAGETLIQRGTKIDNLVQIAHNVEIGEHSIIAGQTGISGSAKIGARVTMGGKVGVRDHVNICDDVNLGGRTDVVSDITEPGDYWGSPAKNAQKQIRLFMLIEKLPELMQQLRRLEQEIKELQKKIK